MDRNGRNPKLMKLNRAMIAAATAAALGTGGIAVGLLSTASTAGATVKPKVQTQTTTAPTIAPDTTQQGDQTKPDNPSAESSTETAPGVEASGAEEPGDASLPGGGHADPAGQNVDHQFEGVE
jgi:hypothetical protein